MGGTLNVTYADILDRVQEFCHAQGVSRRKLKAYGVPRGGAPIAAMFHPVDDPSEAHVIVDDLIDSGATSAKWLDLYPHATFWAPYDKQKDPSLHGVWLVFPWEQNEAPAEDNVVRLLEFMGEDPNREGLADTPRRYLKFWKEFLNPAEFKFTTFQGEGGGQIIIQTDIPFHSVCEHHLAPFYGTGVIAYIPDERIVGLSKLARALEHYARRLQNQERITKQVAEAIQEATGAKGVAVILEAEHMCMAMRGIRKPGAKTRTSVLTGLFETNDKRREELFSLLR